MSRLYDHLGEIVETADGGFHMTPKCRRYFNRFLRQHGMLLRKITTHTALVDALRECTAADFAVLRQRMNLEPIPDQNGQIRLPEPEPLQRLAA